MIAAISRFKVANGMEQSVREAFLDRPRLVDAAPGFLGLETFTLSTNESVFYLVTRWTDAASFQAWHKSPDHHLSHKGIPRGLKLDPKFTELVMLERLRPTQPGGPADLEESVMDAAPFLSRYFSSNKTLHFLVASRDGTVLVCSGSFLSALQAEAAAVLGSPLWDHMVESDSVT